MGAPFSARGMASPVPPGDLSAFVDLVEVESLGAVPDLFGWAGIGIEGDSGISFGPGAPPQGPGKSGQHRRPRICLPLRSRGRPPGYTSARAWPRRPRTFPKSRGTSKGPQSPRRGRGPRNGAPCVLLCLGKRRRSGPCRFQENQTLLPRRCRRRGARQTLRRDYPQHVCGLLYRPR